MTHFKSIFFFVEWNTLKKYSKNSFEYFGKKCLKSNWNTWKVFQIHFIRNTTRVRSALSIFNLLATALSHTGRFLRKLNGSTVAGQVSGTYTAPCTTTTTTSPRERTTRDTYSWTASDCNEWRRNTRARVTMIIESRTVRPKFMWLVISYLKLQVCAYSCL